MANITGSEFDDDLLGTAVADSINGLEGDDTISAGGGNDVLLGGLGNDVLDGGEGGDTLDGGDGDDVLYAEFDGVPAFGEVFHAESLAGGNGDDQIYGFAGRDLLDGGAGNDVLSGGDGADILLGGDGGDILDGGRAGIGNRDMFRGGAGNDTYIVDAGNLDDFDPTVGWVDVQEVPGGGVDTMILVGDVTRFGLSGALWQGRGYIEIENLTINGAAPSQIWGNKLNNQITGNDGANRITGYEGDDILTGRGGNDTYLLVDASDTIVEAAGGGTDTISTAIGYLLPVNVENLVLTGAGNIAGQGNAAANKITGNSGNNVLSGFGGDDTLRGGGGADRFYGGTGNDTYNIDGADVVVEALNEGTDTVVSSLDYTLLANFENLGLAEGSAALRATGNTLANLIIGNSLGNAINGRAGADDMRGLGGDDVYTVDNVLDKVTETANAGYDSVLSSVSFVLSANVESLTLTGTAAINATGNADANQLTGNAAANRLDGMGGADVMAGGLGNDVYVIDNFLDFVAENLNSGVDRVESSLSGLNLEFIANVENATLTGALSNNLKGSAAANVLVGNAGANVIDGLLGADKLTGGLGGDTFVFSQVNAVDTIADFTPVDDTMRLSNAAFGNALTVGAAVTLVANAAPVSAAAVPTFLYDTDNGRLSVDLDGTGLGFSPVLFAILTGAPVITAADFQVVA